MIKVYCPRCKTHGMTMDPATGTMTCVDVECGYSGHEAYMDVDDSNRLKVATGNFTVDDLSFAEPEPILELHSVLIPGQEPGEYTGPTGMIQADCWKCAQEESERRIKAGAPWVTTLSFGFYVCTECGNKRCPRASDHRYVCSHSNATGQGPGVFQGHEPECYEDPAHPGWFICTKRGHPQLMTGVVRSGGTDSPTRQDTT